MTDDLVTHLAESARHWRREEIIGVRPSPVPPAFGIYAWWFREGALPVPAGDVRVRDGRVLLYVGISPSADRPGSRAGLRSRIRTHFARNASGSTLRLTLGLVLAEQLGLKLVPTGSGRLTFGADGEAALNGWLSENAAVSWAEHPAPWTVEHEVIAALKPPLNLSGNASHPFFVELHALRREARRLAREASPASILQAPA